MKKSWTILAKKTSVIVGIKYSLAPDSGIKIQDSGFNIQKGKYENAFQKKVPDFRKPKYVSTIFLL